MSAFLFCSPPARTSSLALLAAHARAGAIVRYKFDARKPARRAVTVLVRAARRWSLEKRFSLETWPVKDASVTAAGEDWGAPEPGGRDNGRRR